MSLCTGTWKADVYSYVRNGSWWQQGTMRIGKKGLYLVKVIGTVDSDRFAYAKFALRTSSTNTIGSGTLFGAVPAPATNDADPNYVPLIIDLEFYVRTTSDQMYINWDVAPSTLLNGGLTAIRVGV